MLSVDLDRVLDYRYHANRLGHRLPAGGLAVAARSGLQDSGPRAALHSLHARVAGVGPEAWRHPSLAQVFGPRGAVYLVPKTDVAVFTVGLLPRDSEKRELIERNAALVGDLLAGQPMPQRDVVEQLPQIGGSRGMRWASTTGRFIAEWDTVNTMVIPREDAVTDEEACRLELARRFFHFLGPASAKGLQWWVDGDADDAATTVDGLREELVPVSVGGETCFVLARDEELLAAAPPCTGVRLLPPDDVYINRLAKGVVVPPDRADRLWPQAPPPGAAVVDGEIVATWRRRNRRFSFDAWGVLDTATRAAIEEEAARLPLATVSPASADGDLAIEWVDARVPS